MVVTGGHNVYPSEVEAVLRGLAGVDDALVWGVPDRYLGSILVAALSGPGVPELTQAEVLRRCSSRLPRHKVPRRIYAVTKWPLTRSGKISRTRIEEWIGHGDSRLVPLPTT